MAKLVEFGTTSAEFEFGVESHILFPHNANQKAGNFRVDVPRNFRITKEYKFAVKASSLSPGFQHLKGHDYIHWYITKDKKHFDLVGNVFMLPNYFATINDLLANMNNVIASLYSTFCQKYGTDLLTSIPQLYITGNKICIHKPKFLKDGVTYYSQLHFGPFICLLLEYETVDVDSALFIPSRHENLGETEYFNIPKLRYSFDKLFLKCNLTDEPIETWDINDQTLYSPWIRSEIKQFSIKTPNVTELIFWFENERRDKIENNIGNTYLHLKFTKKEIVK